MIPSDNTKSQAAALDKTASDETCSSQLANSPSSPQTDCKTPQAENMEPDRHPPQPVREVNLLLGSAHSTACSFQLPPACLCTASVTTVLNNVTSRTLCLVWVLKRYSKVFFVPESNRAALLHFSVHQIIVSLLQ